MASYVEGGGVGYSVAATGARLGGDSVNGAVGLLIWVRYHWRGT